MKASPEEEIPGRRPLASRQWAIMQRIADWMIAKRFRPNAISVSSAIFGIAAGLSCAANGSQEGWVSRLWLIVAAGLMQARLLANLFDGMVAVGSGQRSTVGELYNEVPDRISDVAIFVGMGFSFAASPWLGFSAAIAAVFVAYVRAIGAAAGAGQCFLGPMAKPQRMALMTGYCVVAACLPRPEISDGFGTGVSLPDVVLAVVVLGCVLTAIRRLNTIGRILRKSRHE